MDYAVTVVPVASQTIAAVRARMAARDIPSRFAKSLDQVWAFLSRHSELRAGGHNLFLYGNDMDANGAMTIDFGVQVPHTFEGEGAVFCTATPAGEAASTKHIGPYAGLPAAHAAVHAWMKQNGRRHGGYSWELYGDWHSDPAKLETDIFYLLG